MSLLSCQSQLFVLWVYTVLSFGAVIFTAQNAIYNKCAPWLVALHSMLHILATFEFRLRICLYIVYNTVILKGIVPAFRFNILFISISSVVYTKISLFHLEIHHHLLGQRFSLRNCFSVTFSVVEFDNICSTNFDILVCVGIF